MLDEVFGEDKYWSILSVFNTVSEGRLTLGSTDSRESKARFSDLRKQYGESDVLLLLAIVSTEPCCSSDDLRELISEIEWFDNEWSLLIHPEFKERSFSFQNCSISFTFSHAIETIVSDVSTPVDDTTFSFKESTLEVRLSSEEEG